VSPDYFIATMGWGDISDIKTAGLAQGIFEGTAFGMIFSLSFVGGLVRITDAACSFAFASCHLAGIMAVALVAWALGGLAAMGLATLSPDWYRTLVRGEPGGSAELLRFAWVGGSTLGIKVGGSLAAIFGLFAMRDSWRRQIAREIRFLG
jgi:hypothetical protein